MPCTKDCKKNSLLCCHEQCGGDFVQKQHKDSNKLPKLYGPTRPHYGGGYRKKVEGFHTVET
jgi:hypothetical protein